MEYLYQSFRANSIDFGAYKQTLLENLERFKWLKFQLDTGRPTSRTCHDWNCTRSCISTPLSEFEKEYKTVAKLPFKREFNTFGEKVEGWPSDKVAIERCEKAMREVGEWAARAARVLADTRFFAEMKHDKALPPRHKMKG